uniref:Uncharacterized protein n=1 Tax=Triticum urartu TaxID=4572 RepID=A0A8R7K0L6_TRIUA
RCAPTSPPVGYRKTAVGRVHTLIHLHSPGFVSSAPRPYTPLIWTAVPPGRITFLRLPHRPPWSSCSVPNVCL